MPIITPIIQPFAAARTDNVAPSTSASNTVVNQPQGFPIYQMLAPTDPNYTPVTEEQMNGTLNFYTNLSFLQGQGCMYTFDQNLSNAIGGYPQGAVLWYEPLKIFQVSLKNNNTANFITTPTYINDGINWSTLLPPVATQTTDGVVTIANAAELEGLTTPRVKAVMTPTVAQTAGVITKFSNLKITTSATINNSPCTTVDSFPTVTLTTNADNNASVTLFAQKLPTGWTLVVGTVTWSSATTTLGTTITFSSTSLTPFQANFYPFITANNTESFTASDWASQQLTTSSFVINAKTAIAASTKLNVFLLGF